MARRQHRVVVPSDDNLSHAVPKCVFLADRDIGLELMTYVLDAHLSHVSCVVTMEENEITKLVHSSGRRCIAFQELNGTNAETLLGPVDFLFLLWWPTIIPKYLVELPKNGTINLHPSLLPYDRGKHYNFWTIVDGTPFGVTIHFVDAGVDSGDILFQAPIPKTWDDTGGSLYNKAIGAVRKLFKERYLDIVEGRYSRSPQDPLKATMHFARDLESASEIFLERQYTALTLFNLLRARTFEGKPACYFRADGKKYEVRISISEVGDGSD